MKNTTIKEYLLELYSIYQHREAEALANDRNEIAKHYHEKMVELLEVIDGMVDMGIIGIPVIAVVEKTTKDRAEFEALAQTVADRVGVELDFYDSANDGLSTSEDLEIVDDDGAFNIAKFGVRACFYIGQDVSLAKYNRVRRVILKGMGIDGVEDER